MPVKIEQWDIFELTLQAQVAGNPFIDVSLEGDFTQGERRLTAEGFYDGDGLFKLRFMPDQEGPWQYRTRSNLAALDGQTGEFLCTLAGPGNHGPVHVAHGIHFAYADGTPYIPVGTTCYVWNLQGDELEERTLQTLDRAPFNKIRMCVFPKRYNFSTNEPPVYPFPGSLTSGWDFSGFNPAYFRHLEQRIADLRARGIEADLILFHPYDFGAWGFDRLPSEVNQRYLRYLVARLAAYRNVWWSFANEYDLLQNWSESDWDAAFQLVQRLDPYQHLRSIHNCFEFYDHHKPWVTHCSIQSHQLNLAPVWLVTYNKPVVVDECGYEGDINMAWGDLSAEELVLRFWMGFACGAGVGHGETYLNEREELWWSKGGELRGESVARIAFLCQILEQMPAEGLQPILKMDPLTMEPISRLRGNLPPEAQVMVEGPSNVEAAGYCGQECYLFYYGMHQPGSRNFNLPTGTYRIECIDTWNMTIETVAESTSGQICVRLPGHKYMAIRFQRQSG
jgi:hypothetical protein